MSSSSRSSSNSSLTSVRRSNFIRNGSSSSLNGGGTHLPFSFSRQNSNGATELFSRQNTVSRTSSIGSDKEHSSPTRRRLAEFWEARTGSSAGIRDYKRSISDGSGQNSVATPEVVGFRPLKSYYDPDTHAQAGQRIQQFLEVTRAAAEERSRQRRESGAGSRGSGNWKRMSFGSTNDLLLTCETKSKAVEDASSGLLCSSIFGSTANRMRRRTRHYSSSRD